MPSPIPLPIREAIVCRLKQNQDAATIARELHLCPRSVRHLIRRFRKQPDAVLPSYRPGPGRPEDRQKVLDRAMALRKEHPTWGAGYILVSMTATDKQQLPKESGVPEQLPCERTLQRWFEKQRQTPAPPGRRPTDEASRALHPHHTWQMDAVEQLRLRSKQGVSWLRLVDECSGAFLSTTVFPPPPLG